MEILYLNTVDSTHIYLQNYIQKNGYKNPLAIFSPYQTDGIGSRDNEWIGKGSNFYLSFVVDKKSLPNDLQIESLSIYYSYILKNILSKMDSSIWLKWPNDFYVDDKKIGGTITSVKGELIYCGIGINLIKIDDAFGFLDIELNIKELLELYFNTLESSPLWKQIFSKYLVEFNLSRKYLTTIDNIKVSLKDSVLNKDGSLQIDNKKVFSLR